MTDLLAIDTHVVFGSTSEQRACDFLEHSNYSIITRNFRVRRGEIDIIAVDEANQALCFIEVKAARTLTMGDPTERVTLRKQRTIAQVARNFLLRNQELAEKYDCRFDVIVLRPSTSNSAGYTIDHLIDAFWTE